MGTSSCVQANQRNGNLHITVRGCFTPQISAEISLLMRQVYLGKGNIFIHTKSVTEVDKETKHSFAQYVAQAGVPAQQVYLTGEKGLKVSHDATRVIVYRKKKGGCGGKKSCSSCTLSKRKL